MEDASIIALLKNRDENAIAELAAKYGGLCRSLIFRMLSDRRDAEECLNSMYLRLWNSIPPAEPGNLEAYVAKAARNEALMVIRKNGSARSLAAAVPLSELEECLPARESVEDSMTARALTEAINGFLKCTGTEKRGMFLRRYWFFDSMKEIAARYGTSETRVRTILFRTRKALMSYLKKEGFFNE
ncbi:MAG: sigma-70 family RNA polymerase sigma factor [Oscillospiraceae bacterium]|jgi:RNA polymerase sigma-70 factor (ECF subfamily)|nr:sigma-70 family RNA polymerase sigma factor [Oscillospiraceae bacterium]